MLYCISPDDEQIINELYGAGNGQHMFNVTVHFTLFSIMNALCGDLLQLRLGEIRRSKKLVAIAFALACFTDGTAVALIISFAPRIIRSMNYDICNCLGSTTNIVSNITRSGILSNVSNASNLITDLYYCAKGSNGTGGCLAGEDVLVETANTVDWLNAAGPLAEVVVNPVVGVICSKYGHRMTFLVGAMVQVVASFVYLFAPNAIVLIVARGIQGSASAIVTISGLLMVNTVFDGEERTKVISRSLGIGYPLSFLLAFALGNAAYDVSGVTLPMGILVALALVDFLIRLVLDTSEYESISMIKQETTVITKGTGEKTECIPRMPMESKAGEVPNNGSNLLEEECANANAGQIETQADDNKQRHQSEGSYKELFCDKFVVEALLIAFFESVGIYVVSATSPNWSINVLHAEQWQLGVVLAIGAAAQLLYAMVNSNFISRANVWLYTLIGLVGLEVSLVVYPFVPNIWVALIPEIGIRGLVFSNQMMILPNVLSFRLEDRHPSGTAKGFSLFNLFYTLGSGIGPFAGSLLRYVSFAELYYITAGACAFLFLFPLHWRFTKLLSK
jgi:MFS family permease